MTASELTRAVSHGWSLEVLQLSSGQALEGCAACAGGMWCGAVRDSWTGSTFPLCPLPWPAPGSHFVHSISSLAYLAYILLLGNTRKTKEEHMEGGKGGWQCWWQMCLIALATNHWYLLPISFLFCHYVLFTKMVTCRVPSSQAMQSEAAGMDKALCQGTCCSVVAVMPLPSAAPPVRVSQEQGWAAALRRFPIESLLLWPAGKGRH